MEQRLVHALPDHGTLPEWDRLATPAMRSVLRIQSGILHHLRAVLMERGAIETLAPVVGPVTDPGTRGAKQAGLEIHGHRHKIMSSAILYKQLALHGADAIFMMAPCVRIEPPQTADTGRHLQEFYQCDIELRDAGLGDATDLAEHLVREVAQRIWTTHADDLESIGATRWDVAAPFDRMTHAEAVSAARELGFDVSDTSEIPWEAERALSEAAPRPFLITHYPRGARGFYDKLADAQADGADGLLLDFDLLYPGGFGEAISGAEREHEAAIVVQRMREAGEDPRKYGWYADMLRDGCPASAGFGIGVERLTRWICGLTSVADARPFPTKPGQVGV